MSGTHAPSTPFLVLKKGSSCAPNPPVLFLMYRRAPCGTRTRGKVSKGRDPIGNGRASSDANMKEGGIVRRIFLLAVVTAMFAASIVSVGSAQEDTSGQADICAPWSKLWDLSDGKWYFTWYRWCYNPELYDPYDESSWYMEEGSWEWGEQANLCPESGTCTVSPGKQTMIMGSG